MCTRTQCNGILAGVLLGAMLGLMLGGCSPDSVLGSNTLPPDVPDPKSVQTPNGALGIYRGAVTRFGQGFGGAGAGQVLNAFALQTAVMTDELEEGPVGLVGSNGWLPGIDSRTLPEGVDHATDGLYGNLQRTRGQIGEALGALQAYAPDGTGALRGLLYSLDGYVEVFLADMFCSGIPLSTLDFNGDFTYQPGSSTTDVYRRAVAHFDSALVLATDSADVMNLSRVGRARALLALGDYEAAEQAVADVPDDFRYAISYSVYKEGGDDGNFGRWLTGQAGFTMTDAEGGNGLPYVSSHDPRVPSVALGNNRYGIPMYRPAAYSAAGDTPIVLASGIEARLIEAEARLQAGDASWLATLNALRTDGTFDTQQDAADTTKTDTLWHAGTAGVAGLAPLTDPGTGERRVDVLFQERAYWLFLTGHRQGDLRRLVRAYGRDPRTVYPTGSYAGASGRYGDDLNAPIPADERRYNPLFHGCFNRGA
jgi:hypothetical protein